MKENPEMGTENPIITKATVELTFANGTTQRFVLDDRDMPIDFALFAENDVVDTTAATGEFNTFKPGTRRKVKLHLEGRGPQPEPAHDIKEPCELCEEPIGSLDFYQNGTVLYHETCAATCTDGSIDHGTTKLVAINRRLARAKSAAESSTPETAEATR